MNAGETALQGKLLSDNLSYRLGKGWSHLSSRATRVSDVIRSCKGKTANKNVGQVPRFTLTQHLRKKLGVHRPKLRRILLFSALPSPSASTKYLYRDGK